MGASGLKKLVEIRLFGGLGNQLFQYSLGLYLKKKYKFHTYFNCSWFVDSGSDISRSPDIYCFDSSIGGQHLELGFYSYLNNRYIRYLIGRFPQNLILSDKKYKAIINGNINKKYSYLNGYWQNKFHVDCVRDELIGLINSYSNKSFAFNELMKKISGSRFSVSLHIRRGDYNSNKNSKIYCQLPMSYYHSSVKYLQENFIKCPEIYVFTDDIEWARSNLLMNNAVFVEGVGGPMAELVLMSKMRFNVIANSTFSWWGAYLNDHALCRIAPKKWYVHRNNPQIFDENWVAM